MRHAARPMCLDTSIYHQPNTLLLLHPTNRRPKTIPLRSTPGLPSLTSPLPHLRQCHARSTTQPWPQNQHILCRGHSPPTILCQHPPHNPAAMGALGMPDKMQQTPQFNLLPIQVRTPSLPTSQWQRQCKRPLPPPTADNK
jgi:hypothetical protein